MIEYNCIYVSLNLKGRDVVVPVDAIERIKKRDWYYKAKGYQKNPCFQSYEQRRIINLAKYIYDIPSSTTVLFLNGNSLDMRFENLIKSTDKDFKKRRKKRIMPHSQADFKEKLERKCLKCENKFKTDNRYIRICFNCKATESWKDGYCYEY